MDQVLGEEVTKMYLSEIFNKYPHDSAMEFRRKGRIFSANIKWLKQMKAWGNEESRKMGFIIPQFMIDDAEADDWEPMNDKMD